MNNSGFIFLLSLGASLLVGIVAVARVSAYRLSKRMADRRAKAAAKEPELDLGDIDGDHKFRVGDLMEAAVPTGGGGRRF